ncbi:MAG: TFIIB-type zinc ribbon-containing protein [Clostridiales bacterium]|jgi:ribosomal protein S27E|nr:TFIIB-type zinc ribbon-containing protein [Clostridiales bacterium]
MAENENVEQITQGVTEDVTDKKCPNCGATVTYDPATLSMTCDFCGFHKELPKPGETSTATQEIDFNSAKLRSTKDWGAQKKNIICKNCGGSAMYDMNDTAGTCPFCGSTAVMPVDDDEDVMAPGGVVPFEISQEKAAELFKTWLKKKLFAPSAAKKSCEAKEFKGIYLPYWTYDAQTTSSYSARYGKDYKDKDGNTKTRWYNCHGIYEEFIDDEVVYASTKTKDENIKAVSSFDFKKLRDYDPQFIAGFAAERYSLGLDDGWTQAQSSINSKLKSHVSDKVRSKYNADRVSDVKLSTTYDNITFKYLLAPIWISNFKFNDKIFNFVVNGQTGRIAGKSPVSALRVVVAIIITIAVLALLFYFFGG